MDIETLPGDLNDKPFLTISIVTFRQDATEMAETLRSLGACLDSIDSHQYRLFVIQNSIQPELDTVVQSLFNSDQFQILRGQGNVGFGRAHNLVLPEAGEFHLILNPDVVLHPGALLESLSFLDQNPDCGLVTPHATWPNGERQFLCKRYPAILDLALRGFAPSFIKNLFSRRLAKYEMREETQKDVYWDPPIVSGCFMLFRGQLLKQIGGFDPRFFLYFEDFDLSIRTSNVSRIAYVDKVRITHAGGHAARKGMHHIKLFAKAAVEFYRLHGIRLL